MIAEMTTGKLVRKKCNRKCKNEMNEKRQCSHHYHYYGGKMALLYIGACKQQPVIADETYNKSCN